ncbi:MAG: metalloregulator ArsR/SmtB family transcription factor [Anaerolineae bacterium]|nr:metalloregulator ArsR/SmtB family transcription factor [Anaerolineae bacterium]
MMIEDVTFAKALADETRSQIIDHLCCVWLSVGDLVAKMGGKINQPTVSHHLKVLEEAHLVKVRQEGRFRYYTLDQESYNQCCGRIFRKGNPGQDVQIIGINEITIM